MVFQYAEQQLFEETVAKDIVFGPERQGLTGEALQKRVAGAMQLVHLDEALSARSPFQLSGGQQRRVAIAGILALQPRYLVLDEPTAGLDPCGRAQLMQLLRELHKKQRMTLVLITHNMDDIAELADQLIILHQGVLLAVGEPRELFQQRELLQQAGLQPPQVVQVLDVLRAHGLSVPETAMTLQEAVKAVQQAVKKHKGGKKC
jgi:energy-coupling factor transport system ATP-binding protein